MAVYTKRGDKGETSLYDRNSTQRNRISKDSLKVEAIGAIDELNSYLGVTSSYCENPNILSQIRDIQSDLFIVGSILAGSSLRFSASKTKKLEKLIDGVEGNLPVLKNFILAGGAKFSAHLQYCRSLCRRAERQVAALSKNEKVSAHTLSYLNRLSDCLFVMARKANFDLEINDIVWKGKRG